MQQAIRSPAAVATLLLATAALLAADLVTKSIAFDRLLISQHGQPPQRVDIVSREYEFIPKLLHFRVTANQGAVFGLGQGKRWFFLLVSVVAVGFLAYLFAGTPANHYGAHLLLAMLSAGVLGNMYDRLTLGYVRDMIYALPGWSWPGNWQIPMLNYPAPLDRQVFPWIFNLADSYLCVGVGIVLLHMAFSKKKTTPMDSDQPGSQSPSQSAA